MADLSGEATLQPTSTANNRIAGNPTFGITVGASPFTYVAPYAMAVVISGGTLSTVQYGRAGGLVALGLTQSVVELNPGDSLKVTYLTAPTMTAIPR